MLNVGIIGFGLIGKSHFKLFVEGKINNAKVSAVAINGSKKFDETRLEVGPDCLIYTDYQLLLQDESIDIILITTPHLMHVEIIEDAVCNGKKVLCEKPLGIHYSNTMKLFNLENASIGLMMNQRTSPLMQKINKIIKNSELGELKRYVYQNTTTYRPNGYFEMSPWRGTWKGEGGGLIVNQGVHTIDLLYWLFGMPESVVANIKYGSYHNMQVDDDVNVILNHQDGMVGNLIMSTHEWPGTNRFEIVGTKGSIVLEDNRFTQYINEMDERQFSESTIEEKKWATYEFEKIEYDISDYMSIQRDEHAKIINNFISYCLYDEKLFAPYTDGINTTKLCNMMYLSSFENKEISEDDFDYELYDNHFNKRVQRESEWMRSNEESN